MSILKPLHLAALTLLLGLGACAKKQTQPAPLPADVPAGQCRLHQILEPNTRVVSTRAYDAGGRLIADTVKAQYLPETSLFLYNYRPDGQVASVVNYATGGTMDKYYYTYEGDPAGKHTILVDQGEGPTPLRRVLHLEGKEDKLLKVELLHFSESANAWQLLNSTEILHTAAGDFETLIFKDAEGNETRRSGKSTFAPQPNAFAAHWELLPRLGFDFMQFSPHYVVTDAAKVEPLKYEYEFRGNGLPKFRRNLKTGETANYIYNCE